MLLRKKLIMRHIYYSEDRLKLTNSLKPRFGHNHSQDTKKECKKNSKVHVALNFTQGNKRLDAKPRYPFQHSKSIRPVYF